MFLPEQVKVVYETITAGVTEITWPLINVVYAAEGFRTTVKGRNQA